MGIWLPWALLLQLLEQDDSEGSEPVIEVGSDTNSLQ